MTSNESGRVADLLQPLYPLLVVVTAIASGGVFGLPIALLVMAAGVLGGCIWLVWSSLQGLVGDEPLSLEEALSLGAPSIEEEQKRAVLRALKDLEYEREVGKINDEDYESLARHYRSEAKRLLQVVDRDLSAERERAEKLLAERLAGSASRDDDAEEPAEDGGPERETPDEGDEDGPSKDAPKPATSAADEVEREKERA